MRLLRIITVLALMLTLSHAAGFEKQISSKKAEAVLSADKPLVVGENRLTLRITKAGKAVEGATVNVKFFMPAMPGMPYMEEKREAKSLGGGDYEVNANFSMGGTWQLHIFITPKEGKKFRLKSSVNI